MPSDTSDPGRIERDLDQTRSRLGSHLNELQDRLSPGQVVDDMMAYFRGSEGGEFGRNLMDSVRRNPMPAALTGVGLLWLMASNSRATSSGPASAQFSDDPGFDQRLRAAERQVARQPNEDEQAYDRRLTEAQSQVVGISRGSGDTDQSFSSRVKEAIANGRQAAMGGAQNVRDRARDAAGTVSGAIGSAGTMAQSAAERAGNALSQGGRSASQAGGSVAATLSDNPMLLGALGLAAGALLGSLLPQSEAEEDLLGGVAGQARQTARGLADTAMDKGGNVAQSVIDAARRSAQQHGLTDNASAGAMVDSALSGDLATNAKQVAQDVLKAGDESVHKHVLDEQKKT